MNCEFCGDDTTLCMTVLDPDGSGRSMWLCESCAIQAGAPISPGDTSPRAMIPRLQLLSDFISENGRFPSAGEFDFSGSFPVLDNAAVAPSIACRYFDDLIKYISDHDRIPTDIELPDPF
ncbi:hypothetical protein [Rhodopirellula baltica]|uniref:Uncharacterized protein n=1 Tax=Rhodopirellula baltica SWK14 TaxID=993516 RepID=L7CDX2_RHOBT|nr:hypothetical protein [Rhodopirellula baltica]ELP32030.1 hypothetical protein RBSWK_04028 [Rhodopirellula baltica SWK14]